MVRFPVKAKDVVITGASDGIRRALAIELASRGARVTLSARSRGKLEAAAEEIPKAGRAAIAIPTDVCIENDCRELMENAIAAHGAIDVLVCNAGIGSSATQGDDLIAIEAVRRTMAFNFVGAVHATAAAPFSSPSSN